MEISYIIELFIIGGVGYTIIEYFFKKKNGNSRREKSSKSQSQTDNEKQKTDSEKERNYNSSSTSSPIKNDVYYGRILGLSGKITREDIKKYYRRKVGEYHPDKVASLGKKLREVAEEEMKQINEAYDYFREKYDLQ